MRYIVLMALALFISGCASEQAVLRIIEYRADGPLSAIAGSGVAVHQSGGAHAFAAVNIVYQGERATISISGGQPDAVSE